MTTGPLRRLTTGLLAAFVLALLATPVLFVVTGALKGFAAAFSAVSLPALVASVGFLLWRYLGATPNQRRSTMVLRVLEVLSWVVSGFFLVLVSATNLQTPVERLGASSVFFLGASTCLLPLTLLRRGWLQGRLERIPLGVATATASLILGVALVLAVAHLRSPPSFLGHPSQPIGIDRDKDSTTKSKVPHALRHPQRHAPNGTRQSQIAS
jgi:hypothetical protein